MRVPSVNGLCRRKVAQCVDNSHARRLDLCRCSVVKQRAYGVNCGVERRHRICRVRGGVDCLCRGDGLLHGKNAHQVGTSVNHGLAKGPALGGIVLSLRGGKRLCERSPARRRVVVLGKRLGVGDDCA